MPESRPTEWCKSWPLLRLAGAVLVEAHDEWQTGDRRYLAEGTMAILNDRQQREEVANRELIPA